MIWCAQRLCCGSEGRCDEFALIWFACCALCDQNDVELKGRSVGTGIPEWWFHSCIGDGDKLLWLPPDAMAWGRTVNC